MFHGCCLSLCIAAFACERPVEPAKLKHPRTSFTVVRYTFPNQCVNQTSETRIAFNFSSCYSEFRHVNFQANMYACAGKKDYSNCCWCLDFPAVSSGLILWAHMSAPGIVGIVWELSIGQWHCRVPWVISVTQMNALVPGSSSADSKFMSISILICSGISVCS